MPSRLLYKRTAVIFIPFLSLKYPHSPPYVTLSPRFSCHWPSLPPHILSGMTFLLTSQSTVKSSEEIPTTSHFWISIHTHPPPSATIKGGALIAVWLVRPPTHTPSQSSMEHCPSLHSQEPCPAYNGFSLYSATTDHSYQYLHLLKSLPVI